MSLSFPFCGFPLAFRLDGFHAVYSAVALFMWSVSLLFSPRYFHGHHHLKRYYFFTVLTFLATVGVFLSNDLYAAFVFFEIMSFASYPWVAQEETSSSLRAAQTYLAVAVFGGMVTLMGLFWLYHLTGSLQFDVLQQYAASVLNRSSLYGPSALIFVGFAAKAGVFPLHIWLPKAHPVAPAPASALLSGILTKTGVFGMIVVSCSLLYGDVFWGNLLLFLAGITMVLGAVMAVFSTDLKHTLACSSMSQIGFIMTGLAFTVLLHHENALAAHGTFLHMLNHSLIKLDLFLCAGAVYMNTHSLNLTEIRGFGRKKPLLHFCFLMGYLGLIGVPLFNGFLSKSLIHEAILEYAAEAPGGFNWYEMYEKLFLISGGLTAAYMTKLYLCIFWFTNKNEESQAEWDRKAHYLSPASASALIISSLVLPILGFFPNQTARPLAEMSAAFLHGAPLPETVSWFSLENLKGAAVSLLIGAFVCWLIHRFLVRDGEYLNKWPAWLDLENTLYRPLVARWLPKAGLSIAVLADRLLDNRLITVWIPACISTFVEGLNHIIHNPFMQTWIPSVILAVTGFFNHLTDNLVYFLRHSVFSPRKTADYSLSLSEKNSLAVGEALNHFSNRKDHVAVLEALKKKTEQANQYLVYSVSFGLLLLMFGLCAVLIYLLFIAG